MSSKHEICISGIGGCFPECNNIEELQKNLFEKLNLVTTTDKWTTGALGVPGQIGNIKNIHKFDSTFFGIHRWLCISLDYLTRFSVEKAYEAIIDAGINPCELSGTQTAVIMCSCISESESLAVLDNSVGFGMLGHSRCMQANRISFALNLQGPSYNMDSSWIGGVQALKMACDMVQGGHVPAAIVGVANILNHPFISLQYTGLGKLNYSGETRSFSADAEGYNRGEACVVFFIQRVEDAKRSYGTIVSAKTCSFGVEISPYLEPTTNNLKVFLEEMYNEAGVDPSTIAYLEAEGCAIKSQDAAELNAVEQVMCKNRKDPLLIGSVKSNLGHTEAASSLVSIAKAIIALEQGVIPPNLHFSEPNPLIPGLVNGKMKVVTDATPLRGDTIGVTVHDVTCGIGHVILRQNPKSKKSLSSAVTDGLPRLFVVSSRDEEGMSAILDQVSSLPVDEEFLTLTYNVWNKNIPGHLHRGYAVLPATNPPQVEHCSVSGSKRPVWFIFSGMGSQWAGMGKGLLKLPTFASAIEKCDAVLKTKGVDIYEILTTEDASVLKSILNCFLAIASIQIGLIDVLYELGIKPDGMIGHSVGELGCAYADGCITAEEMIHSTYCRGKASLEAPLIKGMMAAVGMGEKQIRKANLPESIDIACHNSSESCTLSGPAEDLEKYVAELQQKKIFARLVNVSNIAYHSRYITAVGPLLRENSKNVIPKPKLRSKRWISSSFPESKWDTDAAKYCSSEYLVNNLTSPVLFDESCKHIPDNAIIIEIAPHALLQPILLRSLSKDTTNIALTKRGHKDGLRFFLAAVGKMYTSGLLPDIKNLYPPVEYPVSRGTKNLCNLVTWKHSENWVLNCSLDYMMRLSDLKGNKVIKINCMEDKYKIYLDHKIYNCCVLPTSAFLMFIWEKFVLMKEDNQMIRPVIFENFKLFDVVELTTTSTAVLFMMLQKGSGNWEISLDDKLLASGRIRLVDSNDNIEEEFAENRLPTYRKSPLDVCYSGSNVYNILDDSGYSHEGVFRSIKQLVVHNEGFYGEVTFKQWMSFLDGVFKMHVFQTMEKNSDVYYPSQVRQIIIDPLKFQPDSVVQVIHDKTTGITAAPGLKISDVKMDTIPVKLISGSTFTPLAIEEYKFLPYSSSHQNLNNVDEVLNVTAQLIFENFVHNKNMRTNNCKILGFGNESDFLLPKIEKILKKNPEIEIKCISNDNVNEEIGNLSDLLIISDYNHLNDSCNLLNKGNGIILLHSKKTEVLHQLQPSILKVFEQNINGEKFILLKKVENIDNRKWTAIYTSNPDWSSELMSLSKSGSSGSVIYLITYGEPVNGVHEFIKTLNDRFDNQMIRLIFLLDEKCPKFSPTSLFFGKQIALDLKVNVFKNSCWGNFHKLSIKDGICNTHNSKLIQLHKLQAKELSINCLGLNLKSLTLNEQGDLLKNDLGAVEYSGTNNETGEQIMGLASVEPNSFDLIPDPVLFWMKPSGWSFEDAATIPMAYTLAYYSLVEIGRICAGEKILIHCGYTVIGQAAISVALGQGCEVFTTYFKSEQAEVITNQFPQLRNHNLLVADNNFDVNLMMRTKGTGISVVVNCFGKNSNHLQNSLECLSFSGRFLHLGVNIDEITSSFGMFIFLKSVAFYGINPDNIFNHSEHLKHKLKILVQKGIEDGTVVPFKYLINTGSCVNKDATEFICSCSAENPEKKLLHCIKPEKGEIQLTKVKAKEFLCDPDKSYIIVNGKASVWVDVVSWLCQRGARNFVIAIDDQTLSSSVTRRFTKLLSQYAAAIIKLVPSTALNSIKDTKNLVSKASSLGSLDGIFFICVNDLSMIANCDNAIQMLNMKPSIFASIQSVGNNICEKRRANGFSGFSINWDETFSDPANVLLCLDEILNNSLQKNIILNDHGSNIYTERNDLSHYIPDSFKELIAYGQEIKTASFAEVQTLSLPYEQNANSSTLVFIIPSFKPKQLDKLISKLIYPTFKAQLPADICTVNEAASQLAQEIRSFKNLRALTLIASGWGGIIAILLATILEADQKAVSIILLDAEPHRVKQWASNKKGNINTMLLNHYFKLDHEDQKKLSVLNNWEECLDFVLKNEKINNSSSDYIRLGLTAIKNRLTAASNVKLNNIKKLKYSSIYLYEHGDSSRQFDSIKKFSETVQAILSSENDFESMMNSTTIIKSINRNVQIYYPTLETLKRSKVLQKNAEDIFGIVE